MRYEEKSSQDLEKDLAFEWKNVGFEYKTAGCRTLLKGYIWVLLLSIPFFL